jgi:hypothetical protein
MELIAGGAFMAMIGAFVVLPTMLRKRSEKE